MPPFSSAHSRFEPLDARSADGRHARTTVGREAVASMEHVRHWGPRLSSPVFICKAASICQRDLLSFDPAFFQTFLLGFRHSTEAANRLNVDAKVHRLNR
jgi:hypothetical protein